MGLKTQKNYPGVGKFLAGITDEQLEWVKAHTRASDIGTIITAENRRGNDAADSGAKKAADEHPLDERANHNYMLATRAVDTWGEWVGYINDIVGARDSDLGKRTAEVLGPKKGPASAKYPPMISNGTLTRAFGGAKTTTGTLTRLRADAADTICGCTHQTPSNIPTDIGSGTKTGTRGAPHAGLSPGGTSSSWPNPAVVL